MQILYVIVCQSCCSACLVWRQSKGLTANTACHRSSSKLIRKIWPLSPMEPVCVGLEPAAVQLVISTNCTCLKAALNSYQQHGQFPSNRRCVILQMQLELARFEVLVVVLMKTHRLLVWSCDHLKIITFILLPLSRTCVVQSSQVWRILAHT